MKSSTIDKIAWTTVGFIALVIVAAVVLLGWAFIEIIQAITS